MVTTGSRRHHINKGWAWLRLGVGRTAQVPPLRLKLEHGLVMETGGDTVAPLRSAFHPSSDRNAYM